MTTPPTRHEVAEQIQALIDGSKTREEVSLWASKYVLDDAVDIPNEVIARVLESLVGADIFADMENYLFGIEDFQAWLKELGK